MELFHKAYFEKEASLFFFPSSLLGTVDSHSCSVVINGRLRRRLRARRQTPASRTSARKGPWMGTDGVCGAALPAGPRSFREPATISHRKVGAQTGSPSYQVAEPRAPLRSASCAQRNSRPLTKFPGPGEETWFTKAQLGADFEKELRTLWRSLERTPDVVMLVPDLAFPELANDLIRKGQKAPFRTRAGSLGCGTPR